MPGWAILLHVVLAASAAAHVLLNKEDVSAAVGWIGFLVLFPFAGVAIYALFGINRVTRRATQAERRRGRTSGLDAKAAVTAVQHLAEASGHLDQLATVGRRVSGHALLADNRIEPLTDGTAAYPRMLDAIDTATASLAVTSYIFRADRVGHAFIDALACAQVRGVCVRVMIDSLGSGILRAPVAKRLRKAGIPTVLFSRDLRPWRWSVLNLRNHKKLLVVDGKTAFIGGLNFGEENEEGAEDRVRDTHFRVEGPVVAQLLKSFASDYRYACGETLDATCWWPAIEADGPTVARSISSGPDGTIGSIATLFAAAVTEARHRVRLVTPYFLPDKAMAATLRLAVMKGVTVQIVVPQVSNQRLLQWAMQAELRFLNDSDIEFYASPLPFDHSKLVTVDGCWCAVGSANWDARSLRLNFELVLECYGSAAAGSVDRLIDARIAESMRLADTAMLDAPLAVRLRDATARLVSPYL